MPASQTVLTVAEVGLAGLTPVLGRFGLEVVPVAGSDDIPGSYWGAPEAGLRGNRLYLRPDTPVHSALHEAAHFICMGPARQLSLEKDAGGDFHEENAVCYLQILLSDQVPGMGRERMLADMDRWGYTFRLGSARRWFQEDAADARHWLIGRGLVDAVDAVR